MSEIYVRDDTTFEELEALLSSPSLTSLHIRDRLHSMNINGDKAKALISSKSLTSLDISESYLLDDTVKVLASSKSLTSLNLRDNYIGIDGAKALALCVSLTSLNISGNHTIGIDGAKALASSTSLTSLDMSNIVFGCNGLAVSNMFEITNIKRELYNTKLKQTLLGITHLSQDVAEHILCPMLCRNIIDFKC